MTKISKYVERIVLRIPGIVPITTNTLIQAKGIYDQQNDVYTTGELAITGHIKFKDINMNALDLWISGTVIECEISNKLFKEFSTFLTVSQARLNPIES